MATRLVHEASPGDLGDRAMRRSVLVLSVGLFVAGCGMQEPPPRTPALLRPAVDDPSATPTPAGRGRIVLDAVDDRAQVARVISTTRIEPSTTTWTRKSAWPLPVAVQTELLCVTPCTVDLPLGAHELVFSSSGDDRNASRAVVTVSGGRPIVVRHALGYDHPFSTGYLLGAVSLVAGIGLSVMGALVLSLAAFSSPLAQSEDRRRTLMAVGGVLGGLGLTLDIVGIAALATGQARHRDGSTVAFPW